MKDRLCCGQPLKNNKRVAPTVSAPLHLILQAPSPASHEWKRVPEVKRLCQVCHLVVDGAGVRCKSCGLNAHPQCGSHYPANYNLNPFSGSSSQSQHSHQGSSALLANKNNSTTNSTIRIETSNSSSSHLTNTPRDTLFVRGTLNSSSSRNRQNNQTQQQQPSNNLQGTHQQFLIHNQHSHLHQQHHQLLLQQQQQQHDENCFEPRIKKLLQVPRSHSQERCESEEQQSANSSTRFSSSCGDSVAASTAIVVGTTTVSTETPRSESKTPEITITPGFEEGGGSGEADDEEEEPARALLLSSSASVPDSGCTGLLGDRDGEGDPEEEEEEQHLLSPSQLSSHLSNNSNLNFNFNSNNHPRSVSQLTTSTARGDEVEVNSNNSILHFPHHHHHLRQPETVVSSGESGHQSSHSQIGSNFSGAVEDGSSSSGIGHGHNINNANNLRIIQYVDGPLDGAPYALVNPLVKQKTPSSADSGISVDQMKDLDRLLSALVQEAESIPDIPYHAREDSLPFSYTAQNVPGVTTEKQIQQGRRHVSLSSVPSNYYQQQQYSQSQALSHPSHHYHQPQHPSYNYNPPNSAPPRSYTSQQHQQDFPDSGSRYPTQIHPSSTTSQRHQQQQQQQQPPQQHLQLSIEEQILSPEPNNSYSRPQMSSSSSMYSRTQAGGSQLRESASSTNFSNYASGSGSNAPNNGVTRRLRSQSADGRHMQGDEDADEWLARQMKRLQEKRAGSHTVKNDWLAELKRALPNEKVREQQNNDFRPSSSSRAVTRVHSMTTTSGGGGVGGGGNNSRSNVSTPGPYSSDDEEIDREVEMFQRGRKVQRHYSENAYDRNIMSSSSTRAISQQSNNAVDTPGFPMCPPTPYLNRPVSPGKPPRSPKLIRRTNSSASSATPAIPVHEYGSGGGGGHTSLERSQTPVNPRPVLMGESEVKFARDLSTFWYKPNASREETIAALRHQPTGMFLIRNSNSFPGAYGIAIKVNDSTTAEESVRHFLIEPTKYGVRLRGSAVEPVFGSLSALVYAHSVEALALPTTLCLPINDSVLPTSQSQSTTAHLLAQGAACQLLFLNLVGVECVTGDEAVDRAVALASNVSQPTVVSLRLSKQGLTLTDVFRQRFFRLHFPLLGISHAALDPRGRSIYYGNSIRKIFAVVARAPNASENSCVVLSELEEGQPANAIVAFFQRVIAWQH